MAVKEQLERTAENLAKLLEEAIRLARGGNHPHVLRVFAYCRSNGYLVTEYAVNGSAEDVLVNKKMFMARDEIVFVLQVNNNISCISVIVSIVIS